MDTFEFTKYGINGVFRPRDREYRVRNGECVQLPSGRVFRVDVKTLAVEPVEVKDLPRGVVFVDLVEDK